MRYHVVFIIAGLLCLLAGESLGIWMGVNQDFTLAPSHAHLNLVGWATLALFGLIHRAYPQLASARLAIVQCALAIIGAIGLPAGIAVAILTHNIDPARLAAFCVVIATLLFAIMFVGKAATAKAAPA
jgi:hypothetical protein